jgi:putative tricarboxylic transport membrane protein
LPPGSSPRPAKRRYRGAPPLGEGAPEGIAATEAANSSVSGANLIPVLSLGIPGNAAAVFLILAMDSIGGFNPGPSVFQLGGGVGDSAMNPEMVMAFGIFTTMFLANALNWTIGGVFMRWVGVMARIPKGRLLPIVLLLTLTAIYVQETSMVAVWITLFFGGLGYLMRRVGMSPLPFVIAFILGGNLEATARQAFAATGADPFFLVNSPIALVFMLLAVGVVVFSLRRPNA